MKTQDQKKTIVEFYIEEDGGILAYFPKEKYTPLDGGITKICYAHIGQHSSCHPDYVRKLKKATPEQYNDLKKELEWLGYNLIVK